MNRLTVVVPMAGEGRRFKEKGFLTPKPLIEVRGKTILSWSLKSLDGLNMPFDLFLVVRQELSDIDFAEQIKARNVRKINVIQIDKMTAGAAETVLATSSLISNKDSLLVLDCDFYFECDAFMRFIENSRIEDGALMTFTSHDPRFSYVQFKDSFATEVAEKRPISSNALMGAYYWQRSEDFFQLAKAFIESDSNQYGKEKYVSGVVQLGISKGMKFRIFKGEFFSLGTPEEVESFKFDS